MEFEEVSEKFSKLIEKLDIEAEEKLLNFDKRREDDVKQMSQSGDALVSINARGTKFEI